MNNENKENPNKNAADGMEFVAAIIGIIAMIYAISLFF